MLRKISAEELERIISERKEREPLDLSGCLFEDLDLSGWDLRQINFDKSDFRNVRLNSADLSGCSASNAFFQGSSLRGGGDSARCFFAFGRFQILRYDRS